MAYTSGNIIDTEHYNTFVQGDDVTPNHSVENVNSIYGVGNGDRGWGQAAILSVVGNEVVTATQWTTLLARITAIANYTGSSITGITNPTAGTEIEALTALAGNISTVWADRYDGPTFATTTAGSKVSSGTWVSSLEHTAEFTFSSSNDGARYFFNRGGAMDFSISKTGGFGDAKNSEWVDLFSKIGIIRMDAYTCIQTGGGAGGTVTDLGYYDLTASYQTILTQYADSSPYTTNYVTLEAKTNGTVGSNNDNGNVVTFRFTAYDADDETPASPLFGGGDFGVSGSITTRWDLKNPATLPTNSIGTISLVTGSSQT